MDNCSHVSIFLSLIARKLLSLQDLVAVLPNGSAWLNASFGLVIALMTLINDDLNALQTARRCFAAVIAR